MRLLNFVSDKIKRDKNHNRQEMFRFGISFGRNDLNLEGHIQMGYNSKTNKKLWSLRETISLTRKHLNSNRSRGSGSRDS